MSIIPDYAAQTLEVIRQLEAQAQVSARHWSDRKRNEFYEKYINYILEWLDVYIHGSQSDKTIRGRGLNDLLRFIAEKVDEFESEGGSITYDIVLPGISSYVTPMQIMAPITATGYDLKEYDPPYYSNNDVPAEQTPAQISENRTNWTVDRNLNSPGNFSAENLREILNRRRKD